jgi:hypothetical protein
MAGAGGLFLMFIGAVIGLVSGALAVALFRYGSRRLGPKASRALAVVATIGSVVSTLMTLPAWSVILSGKDTRGERFDASDVPFWVYLVLATPFVTLAALVWRSAKARSAARPG